MKLSLFLGGQLDRGPTFGRQLEELAQQVECAERLGFDTVFLPHHHIAGVPYLQPIPFLGFLAARTSRIRLGTAVLLLPLRHPVALAEELATLDIMSGGRITLGVGQGYREEELHAFAVPPAERGQRLEESIGVMRRLWSGESITVSSHFGTLKAAPAALPPVQPGGPPIWIGANGPRAIERAARVGDAWIGSSSLPRRDLPATLDRFRAARRAAGKPPVAEYPVLREASVASTRGAARATLEQHLGAKIAAYARWGRARPDVEETIAECAIVGTPADAAAQIRGYHEDLGINHLILRVQWPGLAQDTALETIRRLGDDVVATLD
jgi:probable F420-dependent oxidoreductase